MIWEDGGDKISSYLYRMKKKTQGCICMMMSLNYVQCSWCWFLGKKKKKKQILWEELIHCFLDDAVRFDHMLKVLFLHHICISVCLGVEGCHQTKESLLCLLCLFHYKRKSKKKKKATFLTLTESRNHARIFKCAKSNSFSNCWQFLESFLTVEQKQPTGGVFYTKDEETR